MPLIELQIIPFPFNCYVYQYIYDNLENFIWQLREIEFFFQVKETDITLEENEANPKIPNDEKHLRYVGNSIYSDDFVKGKRQSSVIIYNKLNELKAKRKHINDTISKYPIRIEWRISKNNSKYTSLKNREGNVYDVIERFTPHLGSIFYNLLWGYVFINANENIYLQEILYESSKRRCRNKGKLIKYCGRENGRISKKDSEARWTLMNMEIKNYIKVNGDNNKNDK